jgi:hypothetical protein
MGKAAVTERVGVRNLELEGDHVEVWKHGEQRQREGEAPTGHWRRGELPESGSHERMCDDGGHEVVGSLLRGWTPDLTAPLLQVHDEARDGGDGIGPR